MRWLLLGFRELPCLPSVCIPAFSAGCHIVQRTWETFFMPVLISSLKTNSRGENSQTKLNAPCLSGFSAKPHFMLRSLDDDTALRSPGRVGAGPKTSSRHGPTVAKWAPWAVPSLPTGAELLPAPLSLRQASRVGVMWATCPAQWSLGLTASPGMTGQSSVTAGRSVTSHLVNNFTAGLLQTDLGSNPAYAVYWNYYFESLNLSVP